MHVSYLPVILHPSQNQYFSGVGFDIAASGSSLEPLIYLAVAKRLTGSPPGLFSSQPVIEWREVSPFLARLGNQMSRCATDLISSVCRGWALQSFLCFWIIRPPQILSRQYIVGELSLGAPLSYCISCLGNPEFWARNSPDLIAR